MSEERELALLEARREAWELMEKQTVWHDGSMNRQYNTGDAMKFYKEAENAAGQGMYLAAVNKMYDCIRSLHLSTEEPAYLCLKMAEYYVGYGKAKNAGIWYQKAIAAKPVLRDPGMEKKIAAL